MIVHLRESMYLSGNNYKIRLDEYVIYAYHNI